MDKDIIWVTERLMKDTLKWEPCLAFPNRSDARRHAKYNSENTMYEDYERERVAKYRRVK